MKAFEHSSLFKIRFNMKPDCVVSYLLTHEDCLANAEKSTIRINKRITRKRLLFLCLQSFIFLSVPGVPDLSSLSSLPDLSDISPADLPDASDLPDLSSLSMSDLPSIPGVPDLSSLSSLPDLSDISAADLPDASDLTDLSSLSMSDLTSNYVDSSSVYDVSYKGSGGKSDSGDSSSCMTDSGDSSSGMTGFFLLNYKYMFSYFGKTLFTDSFLHNSLEIPLYLFQYTTFHTKEMEEKVIMETALVIIEAVLVIMETALVIIEAVLVIMETALGIMETVLVILETALVYTTFHTKEMEEKVIMETVLVARHRLFTIIIKISLKIFA
ncbi:hypothetical protein TNCT_249581 [Trichonephila clavata]|uniref:Uncharacterized protein n=1 Tax=Trichonephila clavata TaxID=2740835 RepID=A0A8X6FIK8_TRICU|nr:hypothetical protein TNCT_249581 [Trichonephila clavata]